MYLTFLIHLCSCFCLGQISITLNSGWYEPRTQKSEDILASVRQIQFFLGWYAHPIFVNGDYPEVMKEKVKEKSTKQGYSKSRLPEFTQQEKQRINGTRLFGKYKGQIL